jgi:hypothetical protein
MSAITPSLIETAGDLSGLSSPLLLNGINVWNSGNGTTLHRVVTTKMQQDILAALYKRCDGKAMREDIELVSKQTGL